MRPSRKNLTALFEKALQSAAAPVPASELLTKLERLGYTRASCYAMVSRAFGEGLLVRSGKVPNYAYRLVGSADTTASEEVPALRAYQRGRMPAGSGQATTGYTGPAYMRGHPPIHTGTPCGGDEELPPVLGACYQAAVGRIFDRAAGVIGEVE